MITKEQYERAADRVAQRIRNASALKEKEKIMLGLGNLRYLQYRNTGEIRAKVLAANCYLAARNLHYRVMS
jgi:hypothetical protein